MRQLKISRVLMVATILVILAFQSYWIHKLYNDEWLNLKKRADVLLKETVQQIQAERLRRNNIFIRPEKIDRIEVVKRPRTRVEKISPAEGAAIPLPLDNRPPVRIHTRYDSVYTFSRTLSAPPPIDSLLARARAEGGRFSLVVSDSVRPAHAAAAGKMISMSIEKPPAHASKPEQRYKPMPVRVKADLLPHADTFIRIDARRESATAIVSDSIQYRKVILQISALIDSIPMRRLDSQYRRALHQAGIRLPYTLSVKRFETPRGDSVASRELKTGYAFVGFNRPYGYQASFDNPFTYIISLIGNQILVSLFLVAITVVSFITLYRSLLSQQRLTGIKNEFISNITHELKTPIATVGVAIEALRNFNALNDPARTREYLDISASELQRLSLLVDKVLKLSMFENREIQLKKETFSLKQLVEEVMATMKLQFEKAGARVQVNTDFEDYSLQADKLHITSVVYNLLDNAIKYSPEKPVITVSLYREGAQVVFAVTDNGIGIPAPYQSKVFDKFFRVPTNDHHNIKGYGLGLSYVCHIVKKHNGSIEVHSAEGKGSTFTVKLPVT